MNENTTDVDVVIVGAGFAGMYQLKRMRDAGFSAVVIETADDVGGTWYWNRYPGARCDILTVDYSYSWDPELETEWTWSERYATQPEILRYANFVADKHDLRRDIRFGTRVESAAWDDDANRWTIHTSRGASDGAPGDTVVAQHYVMATGCLSVPKVPDVAGVDRFQGDTYFTSSWPHEGVDFTGKRVAVIGTGSSGIQSIPIIAEQAEHLTVFQRTPNFSIPAHHGPITDERLVEYRADPAAYRAEAKLSRIGVPYIPISEVSALEVTEAERLAAYEETWARGELGRLSPFNDLGTNGEANDTMRRFIHGKIREIVDDPDIAETLCPTNHYFATKRPCLDTGYYATYNRSNVRLVDLQKDPIATITETGIDTTESMEFDAIVFATGFDAMTGAIIGVDIEGRDGMSLHDAWADGPMTYLGLMTVGFPNLYLITGPGSPSVLSNMMVSIEQHVDWISDTLDHMRSNRIDTIEPTDLAQRRWVQHSNEFADLTLLPSANSWYMGANVPCKPQVFLPYPGGVGPYREICDEVVGRGYLGFTLSGREEATTNDGVIRPVKPDVALMLAAMAELDLPPIESMTPDDARAFMAAAKEMSPIGPDVGGIVDGTYPGADGTELDYRMFRPDAPGPQPVVVYFHGGGWVLGDHMSDEPLCRDLCVRSGAAIISMNYRHAPEARFPAAVDDGLAAVRWVAAHADELGVDADLLAVAGWSAGGNVAAVTCQQARDTGGPAIVGQVLLNPATDCDLSRPSYVENADGFALTTSLMSWFWDHYCDPDVRTDQRASPLRASDLSGLPPAMVVTCEFDPLRDEGDAYAAALSAAGVAVEHLQAQGQTHTSTSAVDVLVTPASIREAMAGALRSMFSVSVPA